MATMLVAKSNSLANSTLSVSMSICARAARLTELTVERSEPPRISLEVSGDMAAVVRLMSSKSKLTSGVIIRLMGFVVAWPCGYTTIASADEKCMATDAIRIQARVLIECLPSLFAEALEGLVARVSIFA